jgi:N-acetylglucosamine-6-sulfatase
MRRRQFLQAATAALASAPTIQTQPARRNIVFILTDDHRYDFIGALGHPFLKGHTPNLDRLRARGVHFRNAFVTSSLCSPSRASILTSRYMHEHGITDNFTPLNPALPAFPRLLREGGYRTGFFGKWHMGGEGDEPQPGFDDWLSFRGQGDYENPTFNRNGVRQKRQGNTTDLLTTEAASFIRANAARPFCLYLSHKAVHAPFRAQDKHASLFATMIPPRPSTLAYSDELYSQWPDWVRERRRTRHGIDGALASDETWETLYRRYCQCLVDVDESVGRIFAQLEQSRLLEDTLFVYMGDNGYMWGEHGLIDKRAMYEPSIRVPLIAHCPALFGNQRRDVDQLALNLDIASTFLAAAGIPLPASFRGRSLLRLASGSSPEDWRREFIYEYAWEQDFPYTPSIVGLRTQTHSLMQYPGVWDIPELYNLQDDPEQRRNLLAQARIGSRMRGRYVHHIKDSATKKLVQDMQTRLAKLLADTGGDARLSGKANPGDEFAL